MANPDEGQLQAQQRQLAKRMDAIQKEMEAQRRQTAALAGTVADIENAVLYTAKYMTHFFVALNARGLMLTSALVRFNKFLELPPHSTNWNAIIDLAFTALAAAVPVLRLTGVLAKMDKAATLALEEAKAAENGWGAIAKSMGAKVPGTTIPKMVKQIPKAGEIADVMKKVNDTRMKALAALKEEPGGLGDLQKLDATKGPIQELIKSANAAMAVYDKALDALGLEIKNRLSDLDHPAKETISALTLRLLPLPEVFTSAELDQIELRFLWEMIGAYSYRYVEVVEYVNQYGGGKFTEIHGLNNTQRDTIVALFGFTAKRGKYFNVHPIPNYGAAFGAWKVSWRREVYFREVGTRV